MKSLNIQGKQVFTGLGHEVTGKKPSPIEILHRSRRVARLASKEMIGQAVAPDYPELVGPVIDETDLTQPEYAPFIPEQRTTAQAASGAIATAPAAQMEMPQEAQFQQPVNLGA